MPTGSEIMVRASTLLQDAEHVRWPLSELAEWINAGVRAIILAKPSACSRSAVLPLVVGTLQTVPQSGDPTPLNLIGITRNLKDGSDSPRNAGRAISIASREMLDAQEPDWHDNAVVKFRKEVRQYFFDEDVPLEFYVFPGNDGTGFVEAQLSYLPAKLEATGDVTILTSWAGDVGLPEPYSEPLLDYVMFRALAKDALTGNPAMSASYYQAFATAVGIKVQVERIYSPRMPQ